MHAEVCSGASGEGQVSVEGFECKHIISSPTYWCVLVVSTLLPFDYLPYCKRTPADTVSRARSSRARVWILQLWSGLDSQERIAATASQTSAVCVPILHLRAQGFQHSWSRHPRSPIFGACFRRCTITLCLRGIAFDSRKQSAGAAETHLFLLFPNAGRRNGWCRGQQDDPTLDIARYCRARKESRDTQSRHTCESCLH
jgi:hypothetical protein